MTVIKFKVFKVVKERSTIVIYSCFVGLNVHDP